MKNSNHKRGDKIDVDTSSLFLKKYKDTKSLDGMSKEELHK